MNKRPPMPPACKNMFRQKLGLLKMTKSSNTIFQVSNGTSKLALHKISNFFSGPNKENCYPYTSTGKFGWCFTNSKLSVKVKLKNKLL